MGQRDSQKGVFAPSMRQPTQLIISGVICTPFSADQRAATRARSASSLSTVALYASQT